MELLLIAVAAVWAIVQLALNKEYDHWAPRLAIVMIRAASLLLPRSLQDRYREEWLAELDQTGNDYGPLSFALLDAVPAALMLAVQRRVRLACGHGCKLLSRLRHGLSHGVGAGLGAGGIVGLGGLLGGLLGALLAAGLTVAGLDRAQGSLLGGLFGTLLVVGLTVWLTARWLHELPSVFRLTGLNAGSAMLGVGLGIGMFVGMALALGGGLNYGLAYGPVLGMAVGIGIGLSAGLMYGVVVGAWAMVLTVLTRGLSASQDPRLPLKAEPLFVDGDPVR
ncbi:MAG: hypothetical protein ACRDYA_02530 [Egibacteraceae bacterium]